MIIKTCSSSPSFQNRITILVVSCLHIQVKQVHQYAVRVESAGRVTLRNRKFLRKFDKIVVTAYSVLPATFMLWKLPTTPTIFLPRIKEQTQENRHKIHLQQCHEHRNWKQSLKFWPIYSIYSAPQRHRQLQLKPHSSTTALQIMLTSAMKTSLCWTEVSCPTSFLLDHQTRCPIFVISLTKPGHPSKDSPGYPTDSPRRSQRDKRPAA